MDYFKENISQILSSLMLCGILLWFLVEALEGYGERKRIYRRDTQRQDTYYHFKEIERLTKAGKLDQARKLMEAPRDKNGNFCSLDQETGRWLQRNKDGTWKEYRP